MRRLCLAGALLVVLVANGWGVWQARQNRSEPLGGTLALTERELPLEPIALESSVTVLRLNWETPRANHERFGPAAWLDGSRLAELGFDCSVALDDARAPRHYSSMPARRVFLALAYKDDASSQEASRGQPGTRLTVVDAGENPERLRERYPNAGKYAICRGTIRVALRTHERDGRLLDTPRLEGWVGELIPAQVVVPKPANRLLGQFQRTIEEAERASATEPRFSAQVHWGKNYEPWVDDIRVTKPAQAK